MKSLVPWALTVGVALAGWFGHRFLDSLTQRDPIRTSAQIIAQASADLSARNPSEALHVLAQVKEGDKFTAHARKLEGDAYQQLHAWNLAEKKWKQALAIDPSVEDAPLSVCNIWFLLGQHEEVRGWAAQWSPKQLDPSVSAALLLEAVRQEHERPVAALVLPFVERVLVVEPKNQAAMRTAGRCLVELRRESEGFPLLESALRLDPNDVRSWSLLLTSLHDAGRIKEAMQISQSIPEKIRTDDSILFALAQVNESAGKTGESQKLLKQVVEKNPYHAKAHLLLARQLGTSGAKDEAERHRQRGLELEKYRTRQGELYLQSRRLKNDPPPQVCWEMEKTCRSMGWIELADAWKSHAERIARLQR
jgi:tetratricopeptide (TPR) repeat protein